MFPPPAGAGIQRDRRAAFVPTPSDVVQRMLRMAGVTKADVVCDLGSGDGRIVIAAAQDHGARGIGYEIDPQLVRLSRQAIEQRQLRKLVTIEDEDMYTADLSSATVVSVYLPEEFLEKLKPKFAPLKPGTRIVSHQFRIPGVVPEKEIEVESKEDGLLHKIYLWTTPLKETGK
ncbi:MAG: class I SAM-dependent methyltransferase [Planctomycetota bacterium]|nr:MAG: class I SAM-dependent methyltransferase [Planctomycetota bacterium]